MGALKIFRDSLNAFCPTATFPKNVMGFCSDGTARKSIGEFLYAVHTYYFSISTRLPEILDCSFQWGLRTPNFGEGEAVGGRGWYRSKEHW